MVIRLKSTDLWAAEVPPDANNYRFGLRIMGKVVLYPHDLFYKTEELTTYLPFPIGSYLIIGEVTKEQISFDAGPYVFRSRIWTYKDYNYKVGTIPDPLLDALREMSCKTKEESFYSILAANGLYFKNPLGENPCQPRYMGYCEDSCQGSCWEKAGIDFDQWHDYEDKLIKGKLLIIQKI